MQPLKTRIGYEHSHPATIEIYGQVFPLYKVDENLYKAIRPSRDLLLQESELSPGNSAIRRCEFFYSLYELLKPDQSSWERPSGRLLDYVDETCGRQSYYRESVEWLHSEGEHGHVAGLYTWQDLEFPITYLEVAYFLYFVIGIDHSISWNELSQSIPNDLGISIVMMGKNDVRSLDDRLISYTNGERVDIWLEDIKLGGRYIPLISYCSVADLINMLGISISQDNKISFHTTPNIFPEDILLREVSKSELNSIFEVIS